MIEKFSGDCLLYLGYTPDQLRKPALPALLPAPKPALSSVLRPAREPAHGHLLVRVAAFQLFRAVKNCFSCHENPIFTVWKKCWLGLPRLAAKGPVQERVQVQVQVYPGSRFPNLLKMRLSAGSAGNSGLMLLWIRYIFTCPLIDAEARKGEAKGWESDTESKTCPRDS